MSLDASDRNQTHLGRKNCDARFTVLSSEDLEHSSWLDRDGVSPCSSSDTTPGAAAVDFTFAQVFDFSSLRAQEPIADGPHDSDIADGPHDSDIADGPQDSDHVQSRTSSSGDASPSMRRLTMAAAGEVDRKNIIRVCLKPSCDFVSSPAVSPPAFLFFVQNSRIAAFLHLLTVPHCQVVASRPVAFYTSLAWRQEAALGQCHC
jgi:hypothetical protein